MIDTRMLETTLPSWFKLLDHGPWRLTLPFMVGALRESGAMPSHREDFDQLYGLLQDMARAAIITTADRRFPRCIDKNLFSEIKIRQYACNVIILQ